MLLIWSNMNIQCWRETSKIKTHVYRGFVILQACRDLYISKHATSLWRSLLCSFLKFCIQSFSYLYKLNATEKRKHSNSIVIQCNLLYMKSNHDPSYRYTAVWKCCDTFGLWFSPPSSSHGFPTPPSTLISSHTLVILQMKGFGARASSLHWRLEWKRRQLLRWERREKTSWWERKEDGEERRDRETYCTQNKNKTENCDKAKEIHDKGAETYSVRLRQITGMLQNWWNKDI